MRRIQAYIERAIFALRGGERLRGFEDEQSSRTFHFLLTAGLGWVTIMMLSIVPIFAARRAAASAGLAIIGATALGSLALLRKGRRRAAAILYLGLLWCAFEMFSALSGGVHSSSNYRGLIIALDAGWLIGSSAAIGLTAATLGFSAIEVLLELTGHPLPVYFPGKAVPLWAGEAAIALMAIVPLLAFLDKLKRQVAALKYSEDRFRSLSDASFEGIAIHDRGTILDANRAFAHLYGYEKPEELLGANGIELLLTPASQARVARRMELGESGALEVDCIRRDGSIFAAELDSRSVRRFGRDVRLVAVRDITERKRADEERAKLQDQLHQAHKMESIGRLAGGIAHDFNNLLTVINGYSSSLVQQAVAQQWAPPARRYAEQIAKAGEMAASLTHQLLAFSRMEAAVGKALHLNEIVAESEEMLTRLVGTHIETEIWRAASPDGVFAYPNQIRQCLMNLVVNARDAMPEGGRLAMETGNEEIGPDDLELEGGGEPGPYVRLTVRDTGGGMDAETKARIFEPFFTTKVKGRGTGLGLATVYGIVTRWHGFVKVRSEPGKGAEFSLYLPLKVAAMDESPEQRTSAQETRPAIETVLVVEDQDDVRDFVVESLRESGYVAMAARNGAEALRVIERDAASMGRAGGGAAAIRLMITDVRMPGMQGDVLAGQVNAMAPWVKVLLMTGYPEKSEGVAEAAVERETMMKPFTKEELAARVRRVLNG